MMVLNGFPKALRWILPFVFAAGLLLNLVIPPFQNPDEPQHFGTIMVYALGEERKDFVEKEILVMMDKHNWWRFVGMRRPDPFPNSLGKIDYLMGYYGSTDFRTRLAGITFYHSMIGKMLRLCGLERIRNLTWTYYLLRLISFCFAGASLVVAWLTFRSLAEYLESSFVFGFFLILFLPQLTVLSVSVNSDAPSIFVSAVFFWTAFGLIAGRDGKEDKASTDKIPRKGREKGKASSNNWIMIRKKAMIPARLILMVLAAALGFLIDRSVFPLVFLAVLSLTFLVRINKGNYKRYVAAGIGLIILGLLIYNALALLFPLKLANSMEMVKTTIQTGFGRLPGFFSFKDFNRHFDHYLVDSFLIRFGWMAFRADEFVYWIWRILVLLAGIGLLIFMIRWVRGLLSRLIGSDPLFKLFLFSSAAVVLQLAGLWGYYGANGNVAQGRHLYPVLIPIIYLFVLGLKSLGNIFGKRIFAAALGGIVLLEFFFLNYVVWNDIIPVFHLTQKSPHPGM